MREYFVPLVEPSIKCMKTRLLLLFLFVAGGLSSFKSITEPSAFDGAWELKEYNYGGNKGSNPKPTTVKRFRDGNFDTYVINNSGARKVTSGKFNVINEGLYTETILKAVNTPMIGKTYSIGYIIKGNELTMSGSYDTPNGKVKYSELWVKISPDIVAAL